MNIRKPIYGLSLVFLVLFFLISCGETTVLTEQSTTTTTTQISTTVTPTTSASLIDVGFDSMGGTAVSTVQVNRGEKLSEPAVSKAGYTLDGWYTS